MYFLSFRMIHFSNVVYRYFKIHSKRRILHCIYILNVFITCADLLNMRKFCTYAKCAPGCYFGHVNKIAYMCNVSLRNGRRVHRFIHSQNYMMFPLVLKTPYFEAVYCFICGCRNVAVARYRMICLVLSRKQ